LSYHVAAIGMLRDTAALNLITIRNVMRIKIILLTLILFSTVLSSCATYKMDIRQGNFVTSDMREKLKIGMTKQQVRYVLGTPMINDAFHGNRWDYVYRFEHGSKILEKENLTLYFENENLARIVDGKQPVEAVPGKAEAQVKG
jgi:outer membrane protein assembly factor BamE